MLRHLVLSGAIESYPCLDEVATRLLVDSPPEDVADEYSRQRCSCKLSTPDLTFLPGQQQISNLFEHTQAADLERLQSTTADTDLASVKNDWMSFREWPSRSAHRLFLALDLLVLIPLYISWLWRLMQRLCAGSPARAARAGRLVLAAGAADVVETVLGLAIALSTPSGIPLALSLILTVANGMKWLALALIVGAVLAIAHLREQQLSVSDDGGS